MVKALIALAALVVIVIVAAYFSIKEKARQFCKYNDLDFEKYWDDEKKGRVVVGDENWMEKYKIKKRT